MLIAEKDREVRIEPIADMSVAAYRTSPAGSPLVALEEPKAKPRKRRQGQVSRRGYPDFNP